MIYVVATIHINGGPARGEGAFVDPDVPLIRDYLAAGWLKQTDEPPDLLPWPADLELEDAEA